MSSRRYCLPVCDGDESGDHLPAMEQSSAPRGRSSPELYPIPESHSGYYRHPIHISYFRADISYFWDQHLVFWVRHIASWGGYLAFLRTVSRIQRPLAGMHLVLLSEGVGKRPDRRAGLAGTRRI